MWTNRVQNQFQVWAQKGGPQTLHCIEDLQVAVLCIALYCSICDALSLQCTVVHLYCTELVTGEHSATFQHLKDTSAEARPGQ